MSAPVFVSPMKQLADGVAQYFADNGITTVVERGWKPRDKHDNQGTGRANRVIFIPSKMDGSAGQIVGPRSPGENDITDPSSLAPAPQWTWRALSDWRRVLQVSIWAYDGSAPNDQGLQDDAVWQLFTQTQRAVQSVAFGNAAWGAVKYTVPLERSLGLELIADLEIQFPIPDVPMDLMHPQPAVEKANL